MGASLPVELWIIIFRLAVDEQPLVTNCSLPISMSRSSWFKMFYGSWALRTPQDLQGVLQRKRYATMKAIISTCQIWRNIEYEYLFASLFFNDPSNIHRVCTILDRDSQLGRRTETLHITRFYASGGHTLEEIEHALISIIRHCSSLRTFVVDWPISSSFIALADALCTFCPRSLRTIHLNVQSEHVARVIHTLDALPSLVAVHIEFAGKPADPIHLGAAAGLALTLDTIQQISLRGYFTEFVEQASGWSMPALRILSLDYLSYRDDLPDFLDFLRNHGAQLTYLDINCIPPLDVAGILDLCPLLTTFAFNPDWRLPIDVTVPNSVSSALVNHPHRKITTIGCHQLLYAFGVGYAATYAKIEPTATQMIRRTNDINFSALNKRNFPNLQRIRILNKSLLRDLEAANGPDQACFERWERWWMQCAKLNVRLEDCTGAELGNLPDDETEDGSELSEGSVMDEEQADSDLIEHLATFPPTPADILDPSHGPLSQFTEVEH